MTTTPTHTSPLKVFQGSNFQIWPPIPKKCRHILTRLSLWWQVLLPRNPENRITKFAIVCDGAANRHAENRLNGHYENIQTAVKRAILLECARYLNMSWREHIGSNTICGVGAKITWFEFSPLLYFYSPLNNSWTLKVSALKFSHNAQCTILRIFIVNEGALPSRPRGWCHILVKFGNFRVMRRRKEVSMDLCFVIAVCAYSRRVGEESRTKR